MNPPDHCQLCGADTRDKIVDGATRFGPWAWMCEQCHKDNGYGFGTGKGQLFQKLDEQWKKVQG